MPQVDYHLITDLLPMLSKLYFLGRMPSARMSHLQEAILLAMGLQHRQALAEGRLWVELTALYVKCTSWVRVDLNEDYFFVFFQYVPENSVFLGFFLHGKMLKKTEKHSSLRSTLRACLNPFRTAVPFWGQLGTNNLELDWFVPSTGLQY